MRKILTIKMEVYAEERDKPDILHSEEDYIHTRKEKMKKQNINLKHLTNYLIQMFYKTGQKYTCTQTKIGKLLSIIAFSYARKEEILFEEIIYKYNGCGTAINELKLLVPDRDIYIRSSYFDGQHIIEEPLKDDLFNPLDDSLKKYAEIGNISEELKSVVEDVFRKFGALSPRDIGQHINLIVECDGVTNIDGSINLEKISEIDKNYFKQSNVLIDYLLNI